MSRSFILKGIYSPWKSDLQDLWRGPSVAEDRKWLICHSESQAAAEEAVAILSGRTKC